MRLSRCLLLALLLSPAAMAQSTFDASALPPEGTLSKQLPPGVDVWIGLAVSDDKQIVRQGIGSTETEARLRARQECAREAGDCQPLSTLPVRDTCMGVAADRAATPGTRAIFVAHEVGGSNAGVGQAALAQCTASGAQSCEIDIGYCF
ncbi:DUF4189 domain-containing protein [Luteimonas sp. XNQY3]|nr:DUF4189 domain-containing protein [Luteimonas sp. XNQY3]MCD9006969.1 DUF4189 domain-containing protein [Luteimonas sp. XNQY3]